MQTPTHLLMAAAALTRPGERTRNMTVLAGALLPDLSIFVLFLWSKLAGIPERQVWRQIYWQDPWQTLSAISNSLPIWGVLLIIGLTTRIKWLWVVAAAALLHLSLDFPVHNGDAHKHFWPLTDWRFRSPLSYWDPAHHGGIVAIIEAALGALCVAVLWGRFAAVWVRSILAVLLVTYAAVPIYFRLALG